MKNPNDAVEVDAFASKLRSLRIARRKRHTAGRASRKARRALSAAQRKLVLKATGGRCHLCGGKIGLGPWTADHVLAHAGGGHHALDNYLPAHVLCNGYRWSYQAEEFQQILKIGVWTRTQVERKTKVGSLVARHYLAYEKARQNRSLNRGS